MASIEATSAGLASGTFDGRLLMLDLITRLSDFDIEDLFLTLHASQASNMDFQFFQHLHRRVMPGNATDRAAA
jgi:hypothetical protein